MRTCRLQETHHAETLQSYLVSSLPKQEVFLSAVLLFLLTVRITFGLIHGCRCRMSHVIVVAVGSVKFLLPSPRSSSLIFIPFFHLYHILQVILLAFVGSIYDCFVSKVAVN